MAEENAKSNEEVVEEVEKKPLTIDQTVSVFFETEVEGHKVRFIFPYACPLKAAFEAGQAFCNRVAEIHNSIAEEQKKKAEEQEAKEDSSEEDSESNE